ncbi:MAG: FHA domain-containing protein [Anaerolineales bacterium]|jgi:hypothetical protein
MTTKLLRSVLVAAFMAIGVAVLGAAAQSGTTFFVTNVDSSGFPVVSFDLRAVGLGQKVVSGLNAGDITVYENGQEASDVQVTPSEDGPITYIFVIDQGRLANFQSFGESNIRQAITTLVSGGFFKDGKDTVMVLARQNTDSDQTVTLLPATQSGSDLTTWAAAFGFDRGSRSTKGLLAVDDAVNQLGDLVEVPGSQTAAILFFTRFIEDPSSTVAPTSATNTAAKASDQQASVYVFQTDLSQSRRDALQLLAEGSGGIYTGLTRSGVLSQVSSVYQIIDSQRAFYSVSYRSAIGDVGRREITINTPTRPSEGAVGSYEVSPTPPSVSITEPTANSTIRREATLPADSATPVFDTSQKPVTAEISWPDGFPRQITTAQLFVNGNLESSADVAAGQSTVTFNWDLSDITDIGINPVSLRVNVTDELGLSADGESSVDVAVAPPPTSSTGILGSVPTAAAIGVPVLCVLGILGLAVLAGAFFLLRGRSKGPAETGTDPDDEAMRTMFQAELPELALATLTVMEGPSGMIGERLKVTGIKVSIGRDPSQSDISFYSDAESSVSRLHCTIELNDDNAFRLTDKNSSAGTRLNGRRIQANSPVVLADGDEIVLGDLAQRGVKLQFNFARTEEQASPYSGTADDRTHLIDTPDPDDWGN